MSHDGTVNGYASYKVADEVENHYAVGLGVYNVFIYTGPTYDSTKVQIVLDNAIEVPDKDGVLIENACLQTFADSDKALQKIKSIVNGKGDPVSSGIDPVTGETGTNWDRSFLLYYCNGKTEGSSREVKKLYDELKEFYETHKDDKRTEDISDEDWDAFQDALTKTKDKLDEGVPISLPLPVETSITEEYSSSLKALQYALDALEETDPDDESTPGGEQTPPSGQSNPGGQSNSGGQTPPNDQTPPGGQSNPETTATTETNTVEKDNLTTINIKNKKTYKTSKKIIVKDKNGIKNIKLNKKTIKVNNKKSYSFKLSKYKKYLKKTGKWNKLVITDKNGKKKTIKFKTK